MQLPVRTIILETLGYVLRFIRRHPIPLLIALTCSVPLQYWLMEIELAGAEQATLSTFAESCALLALGLLVWLPLLLLAIRETVSGEVLRLDLGGLPSTPTWRYAACGLGVLLALHFVGTGGTAFAALVAARIVLGLAVTWFILRTTLTFTALALGRLDLSLRQSIAKTSGLTWKLLLILVAPSITILTVGFVLALAVILLVDESGGDARTFSTVLFGVSGQIVQLATAISGALIYRAIEQRPDQTGQY